MIYLEGRKQDVDALVFSPDGSQLAVGGSASHVQLWDLEARTVRQVLGPTGPHRAVAFRRGGGLMTVTGGGEVRFQFRAPGAPEPATRIPHMTCHGAALVFRETALVVCGQYHASRSYLARLDYPALVLRWAHHGSLPLPALRLCPCPDGSLLCADCRAVHWVNPGTGEIEGEAARHQYSTPSLALNPDGSLLAIAAGTELQLIRLVTRERTAARVAGRRQLTDVAFHPSGRWLLASSNNQTVRVYDGSLKELATFDWEVAPVRRVAFSPDGMRAAAAGKTGRVALWDFDV